METPKTMPETENAPDATPPKTLYALILEGGSFEDKFYLLYAVSDSRSKLEAKGNEIVEQCQELEKGLEMCGGHAENHLTLLARFSSVKDFRNALAEYIDSYKIVPLRSTPQYSSLLMWTNPALYPAKTS